jgi:hypothetical protein
MANNTPEPAPELQRDIDKGDVGQSGYTSGRSAPDPALRREVRTDHSPVPADVDDEHLADELATDERFHGRGGHGGRTP